MPFPAIFGAGALANTSAGFGLRTALTGAAAKEGMKKMGSWFVNSWAGRALGFTATAATATTGAMLSTASTVASAAMTAGLIVGGIALAVGAAYGVYKLIEWGFSDDNDKQQAPSQGQGRGQAPELAQAMSPAMQPMMTQAMTPPPVTMGAMVPGAYAPTIAYPAAVVDMQRQMAMQASPPPNSWAARVGGSNAQQGSFVQSLTDQRAVEMMNQQHLQ